MDTFLEGFFEGFFNPSELPPRKLRVDPRSGQVTVAEEIDRESPTGELGLSNDNEIRLTVIIQDTVAEGEASNPNVVRVPISVIVLDENDNEPVFRGTPYKSSLNEDTPVGTTIFRAIEATDRDLVGEVLEVTCVKREGYAELCDYFDIVPRRRETDHDMFRGSVILKKELDYRERQIFQIPIAVFDGVYTVESDITFTVNDVQNSPPVFMGSLTGIVNEDDAIGTPVLRIRAKDGDTGNPRRIIYDLVENEGGYFVIDSNTGQITVDRHLDRESLSASSGVLGLKARAAELVNGVPGEDGLTSSVADVTITIRDVNDEAPMFNRLEYEVTIPENVPFGTPLANLNMEVKDTDTGPNSVFKIDLLDNTDKFSVEPARASGHTAVSLKVNTQKLDYENPNERKFLLLVVATETNTEEKLSSTATVTVQIQDLNDNSPSFDNDAYTAIVSESATEGAEVTSVTARDRDSGDYGTQGIRYKLMGTGSDLFNVDPISGRVTVAACDGSVSKCLDYEDTKAYFLSYSATDNNGEGKRTVVNLRITVADANDNPPLFDKKNYVANIDEGQVEFQPRLFLKSRDADDSSVLQFKILDGNINKLFTLDTATGEVTVSGNKGLRLDNIPTDKIRLNVEVTDSLTKDFASVEIDVRDVNDRNPIFEKKRYLSSVPETAAVGTPIENVMAKDADYGKNAEIAYRIQKGAYDDFEIDPVTGLVSTTRPLDFDRRDQYVLELVAVDGGMPSLSGTATLTVNVMNKNDKAPYFSPTTQRTHITEDAPVGSLVIELNATDADVADASSNLLYSVVEPITAVDHDGKQVDGASVGFKGFFGVNASTGQVFVTQALDRNVAAIVTLTVVITDHSAEPAQHGYGSLVVTIVDVNDFAPRFQDPWSEESPYLTINVAEEQPNGTAVHKFMASDADSNIDYFRISPKNKYFGVEKGTGNLYIKSRIDFEALNDQKRITFDLHVFDAGVPQKSASAMVIANIENLNDEVPQFGEADGYKTSVAENSPINTPIVQVAAVDEDEGDFGRVHYQLSGTYKDAFSIGPDDGAIVVLDPSVLDRERAGFVILQVVAADSAPFGFQRSSTVPVNVTIVDANDNPPVFTQRNYEVVIVDNIPYYPEPSPITQLTAVDADIGLNAKLHYSIVSGNEEEQFFIDAENGIVYPNASFLGQSGKVYDLTVEVADEGGEGAVWESPDRARVVVSIENVNTHKPEWFPEPPPDQTLGITEEQSSEGDDFVILKVNARDRDVGENQRISYFIKVNNKNELQTDKFGINEVTGELRAIGRFDREATERYELILVARDHGTPVAFETLRFVTVIIKDINDNGPKFPESISGGGDNMVRFTVPEEEDPGYFVGRVRAEDPDAGVNGRVFYYIIGGNEGHFFSIDKIYGNIYTKKRIDREKVDQFDIMVKATNNPDFVCEGSMCDIEMTEADIEDRSTVKVQIFVEDKNDNLPRFRNSEYFVGIPFDAKVGDLILNAEAFDPDLDNGGSGDEGGFLVYSLRSSNLFRAGATTSSGSLVPSPFEMRDNGRLVLGSLMAEFNQDRFVIDIEAKEPDSNHRAKARVHLWVYEPEQLIKLVINKRPTEVNREKFEIIEELRNVTQEIIVIDEIKFHVSEETGLDRDMTDMYIHAVREETNEILMPEEVLKSVDANYDYLSAGYYQQAGIHSIVPAAEPTRSATKSIDANLIALIGLLVVIFFGAIMFSILCCCMKSWVAKASASASTKPQRLKESIIPPIYNPASIMEEAHSPISPTPAGGTDNPLWIDQKYKAYEEQELTMTVFSDQENSVISSGQQHANGGGHGSVSAAHHPHLDAQSNAYATINKLPMVPASRRSLFNGSLALNGEDGDPQQHLIAASYGERDYATLEKSVRSPPGPLVPGIHSTPVHQDSMPRRRFSNDFSSPINGAANGSRIVINKNGEPELVADLM